MTPPRLLLTSLLAVPALVTLPAAGIAQSASLEDRLQRLESEVGFLRQENQQLRSELGLGGRADQTPVKAAGSESTLRLGGLLQAQADFGDKGDARFTSGNDRFYLRRARINVQGKFLEAFDFKMEGEFAGSLAEAAGSRAQLTDAYVTWTRFAFANIRVGQFKTPFGFEQLYADPRLFTIERSLANDRLTFGRQIGVQVAGNLLDQRVSYATGWFNGSGVNTSANDNESFLWSARVSAVAWRGAIAGKDVLLSVGADAVSTNDAGLTGQPSEFGLSSVATAARNNTFTGRREAGGLDAQVHVAGFDLWGEYLRERFKPTSRIPSSSFDAEGWYVQGGYFVVPRLLQALVKYDVFAPNVLLANNRTRTWMLGANYLIQSDDLKLQFDYLMTDIDGQPAKNKKLLMRLQAVF